MIDMLFYLFIGFVCCCCLLLLFLSIVSVSVSVSAEHIMQGGGGPLSSLFYIGGVDGWIYLLLSH